MYRALGGLDENTVGKAMEYRAGAERFSSLRAFAEIAAVIAVFCGALVLSAILRNAADPSAFAPASGSSSAESEKTAEIDVDTLIEAIYADPGTTKTEFQLKQPFDPEPYKNREKLYWACITLYYDQKYDLTAINYPGTDNDPVLYKPPYVRYDVTGYPNAHESKEQYVTHVDICGDDTVSICGININSSFEDFKKTFSALGMTVREYTIKLPYGKRECIEATSSATETESGLWIVLEKESEFILERGVFEDYEDVIEYDGNKVPGMLRMGIPVETYTTVEQYLMP
jgi:hypothetical protein